MLLLGAGPRALLLQLAHPAVAAGVADHSDFRADPWARLQGTLRSYLRIVYGTADGGTGGDPPPERAPPDDHRPDLPGSRPGALAVGPRDARRLDDRRRRTPGWSRCRGTDAPATTRRRCRSAGRSGSRRRCCPADLEAFEAYVAEALAPGGPIRVDATARELAHAVLHPPLGPVIPALAAVPAVAYAWTLWPAVGLLPAAIREAYELPWGPLERSVAAWLVASWRAWRPLLPATFRQMPQALAADRRLDGARAQLGRPSQDAPPSLRMASRPVGPTA